MARLAPPCPKLRLPDSLSPQHASPAMEPPGQRLETFVALPYSMPARPAKMRHPPAMRTRKHPFPKAGAPASKRQLALPKNTEWREHADAYSLCYKD